MRETRKQIIELIEPYMDKTEIYNFLFRDNEGNIREMNQYMFIAGNEVYIERAGYNEPRLFCDIKEVIGHYDITAVLKYIDKIQDIYTIELNNEYFSIIDYYNSKNRCDNCDNVYDGKIIGCFYNKPLHLYTEQEEKDLLTLLKKLGTYEDK